MMFPPNAGRVWRRLPVAASMSSPVQSAVRPVPSSTAVLGARNADGRGPARTISGRCFLNQARERPEYGSSCKRPDPMVHEDHASAPFEKGVWPAFHAVSEEHGESAAPGLGQFLPDSKQLVYHRLNDAVLLFANTQIPFQADVSPAWDFSTVRTMALTGHGSTQAPQSVHFPRSISAIPLSSPWRCKDTFLRKPRIRCRYPCPLGSVTRRLLLKFCLNHQMRICRPSGLDKPIDDSGGFSFEFPSSASAEGENGLHPGRGSLEPDAAGFHGQVVHGPDRNDGFLGRYLPRGWKPGLVDVLDHGHHAGSED